VERGSPLPLLCSSFVLLNRCTVMAEALLSGTRFGAGYACPKTLIDYEVPV
jgi:hypothetical protein